MPAKKKAPETDWGFGSPSDSSGDRWKAADHLGELTAFVDVTLAEGVGQDFGNGPDDAADCSYIVTLDGKEADTVYEDAWVFGKALVPALTRAETQIIVGRVVKGEAKPGRNAPYLLDDPTDEDLATAQEWFSAHASQDAAGGVLIAADEAAF